MTLQQTAKARSAPKAKLDADAALLRRVDRMTAFASMDVKRGQELSSAERTALEAAARQMAMHGRDR